jgi:hypothetical protein
VLTATVADEYMTRTFPAHVEVVRYDGHRAAVSRRASRQPRCDRSPTPRPPDVYGPQFPVQQIGAPREHGYYVMYLRPGNESCATRSTARSVPR